MDIETMGILQINPNVSMERENKHEGGDQGSTKVLLVLPARDARHEIHFRSPNPPGPVPNLVTKEQAKEDRNRQISNKQCCIPISLQENAPLGEEDDNDRPHQTLPSRVRHQLAAPREVLVAGTLLLQALPEPNPGDTGTDPVEHHTNGDHVGEPAEKGTRGLRDGEI